ncbi:VOC family protein [Cohnella hongkongensis]|uniref:VOC family protein n=1 Tax=Cohnella hongkongensis TaxID=178337 RepID=A0ABV9FDQ9_9BACL
MTQDYKPKGHSAVTPYVIVDGADRFIEFVRNAFEAEELERHKRPDGSIQHAACRIGDAIIEIGGGTNPDFPPTRSAFHLFVKDADEVYSRALKAGARSLYEPQNHDYGERSGGIEDPFGNHWYIATNISR